MTEPITAMTAGAILNLAFQKFVASGASEAAKKTIEKGVSLTEKLKGKIISKLEGKEKAREALTVLKERYSTAHLAQLEMYLDLEMKRDNIFATELREVAQQMIAFQNQATVSRNYENYGRDQINIDTISGNPRIGGS